MSINLAPRIATSPTTRLLYCAYDGRVTRHHVRGQENALVCAECGHHVRFPDPGAAAAAHPVSVRPSTAPFAPTQHPREGRGAVRVRRRGRPWQLAVLVAAAIVVGSLTLAFAARVGWAPDAPVAPVIASRPGDTGVVRPVDVSPVRVANTDGQGAYLRRTTNLEDRLQAWPDGTVLRVMGADTIVDALVWRPVVDPEGNRGWIPAKYTAP